MYNAKTVNTSNFEQLLPILNSPCRPIYNSVVPNLTVRTVSKPKVLGSWRGDIKGPRSSYKTVQKINNFSIVQRKVLTVLVGDTVIASRLKT